MCKIDSGIDEMTLKGIYHIPPAFYSLAADLGFTHAHVWDQGSFLDMKNKIFEARKYGLHVFVSPHFLDADGSVKLDAVEFLKTANLLQDDLVYLPDEPNMWDKEKKQFKISPSTISHLSWMIKQACPQIKTICVLSWLHAYQPFANSADILGLDYYKRFWEASALVLVIKYLRLKLEHQGEIWGVGAVKYSPAYIKHQAKFWRLIGVKDMLWYPWTPSGEAPGKVGDDRGGWPDKDLNELPDFQEALKGIQVPKQEIYQ